MQRSKNLAVAFLLGAVLVGGALGFTADRVMIGDRIRADRPRLHLADRLQLDAAQRAKLDTILDNRRHRIDMIIATVRDQLDSAKLRARAERLVAEVAGVGRPRARRALRGAHGRVRLAIVMAHGNLPAAAAARALRQAGGSVRPLLGPRASR